jgi:hypothetical protein
MIIVINRGRLTDEAERLSPSFRTFSNIIDCEASLPGWGYVLRQQLADSLYGKDVLGVVIR